ncbi:MAG: ankyrin repeat domain-containing protein [Sedimenticola sp.]
MEAGDAVKLTGVLTSSSSTLVITPETGRELVLSAVRNKDVECVQLLLKHDVYKGELEKGIADNNDKMKPTLLGEACSEQYICKEVAVTLLYVDSEDTVNHMAHMSQMEWNYIVSNFLKAEGGDIARIVYADVLKTILSKFEPISNPVFYDKLQQCDIIEHYKMNMNHEGVDIDTTMDDWLYEYLQFRTVELTSTMRMLKHMLNDEWTEAENKMDELSLDELDEPVLLHFPERDCGTEWTLLTFCVYKGKVDLIRELLLKGVYRWQSCSLGIRLLMSGDDTNKSRCHSSIPDGEETLRFETPVSLAVYIDSTYICELLLRYEENSDVHDWEDLRHCITNKNVNILKLLLRYRRFNPVDLVKVTKYVEMLHADGSMTQRFSNEVELYLIHNMRFEMTKSIKAFLAIEDGDIQRAMKLVSNMSINEVNEFIVERVEEDYYIEITLVVKAVIHNHTVLVKLMIDVGANINVHYTTKDDNGDEHDCYPLLTAVQADNAEMCLLLLQNGASIEAPSGCISQPAGDYYGDTPIQVAISHTNVDILEMLLKHGTDLGTLNPGIKLSLPLLKVMMNLGHISADTWLFLLCRASNVLRLKEDTEAFDSEDLIRALVNFMPTCMLTPEFKEGLTQLREWLDKHLIEYPNSPYTYDICERWEEYARQAPSLAQLCRYTVRQACEPCDDETFKQLGLPTALERYLCHMGTHESEDL